ncbi:MAG: Xaa-Pro peptidase family protein [Alphaproteobacteria bacterium]|nr:Xaa-Pro peptidase family protein [Alphaproteobacteria bacterium]
MRVAEDFPRFSGPEMAQRHAKVAALMEVEGVDALLAFGSGRFSSEIYWLSDWPGSREAYVLFQKDAAPLVLLQLYNHVPMARVLSVIEDVRWAGANTARTVAEALVERGLEGRPIGIVGSVPYRQYQTIAAAVGPDSLKDIHGAFRMMRTIRSAEEIERIERASDLTDKSMAAIEEGLRVGMTEWEIPALIEPVYLDEGGYAGIHFITSMPMDDPHFPVPAQYQSNRRLGEGDVVITEISGAYWGYSGQIHRTYSLGRAPDPAWAELHAVAVEAFETLAGFIKEGVTSREVEEVADLIHERGYAVYDDLLHGVNQSPPIIQTAKGRRHESADVTFRENMVVTIQPNVITKDERMGLQFGETLVVGKEGCKPLNHYPRKWVVCGG